MENMNLGQIKIGEYQATAVLYINKKTVWSGNQEWLRDRKWRYDTKDSLYAKSSWLNSIKRNQAECHISRWSAIIMISILWQSSFECQGEIFKMIPSRYETYSTASSFEKPLCQPNVKSINVFFGCKYYVELHAILAI